MSEKMKISIIGANGFIGKNFIEQLDNIRTRKARWYKVPADFDIVIDAKLTHQKWINTDILYVLFDGRDDKFLQTMSEYLAQNPSKQSNVVLAYSVDDESKFDANISELTKILTGFSVTTY